MKRQQRSGGSIGLALPQLDLQTILFERNTLNNGATLSQPKEPMHLFGSEVLHHGHYIWVIMIPPQYTTLLPLSLPIIDITFLIIQRNVSLCCYPVIVCLAISRRHQPFQDASLTSPSV